MGYRAGVSPPSPIHLGPFALSERFAQGGFGAVWRGVHRREGLPVAAKVLTGSHARRPDILESFRDEVRAAAGLDHQGIVAVYDYGTVGAEAATASRGRLAAGSPYLVMELAAWGSLADVGRPLPWPVAKGVLLGLLDALAYAHARGIIHRDLKPGNVLVAGAAHRPVLKLADFGIAHAMHAQAGEEAGSAAGTPNYMSPEQLRGGWRMLGPWTDLYALGCVAHQLLTGAAPYERPGPLAVLMAHLEEPIPEQPRALELPDGAWTWVQALLAKDPRRRPRCAADAADALASIGGDPWPLVVSAAPPSATYEPTVDVADGDRTDVDTRPPGDSPTEPLPRESSVEVTVPVILHRTQRMGDWRRTTPLVPPAALRDAGLGLFGLRGVPLVGREAERDALWLALRAAIETGLPGVVLIEGAAGTGKSRLAEWCGERAHELGLATLMRARHAPTPEPGDGMVPMVARELRAVGLSADEIARRVAFDLDLPLGDATVGALTALLRKDWGEDTTGRVRLHGPDERNLVLRRFLATVAAERAVVVLLDDVVWGPDAIGFVEHVLAWGPAVMFPVLFVLTARSEALAERTVEAARLDAMMRRPNARRIELGPLPPAQHARLVRELLGLEGPLAARLAERSAGNPQFAVQLVGDWVQRDLLEPGEQGFRLRVGADLELPADLQAVWDARVAQVLRGRPADDGVALELAATLGHAPGPGEWADVCWRVGVTRSADLLDALMAVRLARARSDGSRGWRFEQGMFTESLLRRASRAGRAAAHHRACAETLAAQTDDGGADRAERLGRHLLAAGDALAALAPLLDAARRRFEASEYVKAQLCLAERERGLAMLGTDEADPLRIEGELLWCWIERSLGDLQAADRRLRGVELALSRDDSAKGDSDTLRSQRDLMAGVLAFAEGKVAEARAHLQRAEAAFAAEGDRRRLAHCRSELAKALLQAGALSEATTALQAALVDFTELGDPRGEARCHMGLALLARAQGDLATVERRLAQAQDGYERAGTRLGVAESLNQLGDCARLRGDSGRAVRLYREAMERFLELEAPSVDMVRANLAQALIDQGRHDDARVHLDACIDRFAHRGQRAMVGALQVVLLLCDAHDADWDLFAEHLRQGRALLQVTGFHDLDVARAARAAGHAVGAGRPDLAGAALLLARSQFQALDRADDVLALDVELAQLRG